MYTAKKITPSERLVLLALQYRAQLSAAELQKQTEACDVTLRYTLRSLLRSNTIQETAVEGATWKERRLYSLVTADLNANEV